MKHNPISLAPAQLLDPLAIFGLPGVANNIQFHVVAMGSNFSQNSNHSLDAFFGGDSPDGNKRVAFALDSTSWRDDSHWRINDARVDAVAAQKSFTGPIRVNDNNTEVTLPDCLPVQATVRAAPDDFLIRRLL